MGDSEKQSGTVWGRCRISKFKVYWVVWRSVDDIFSWWNEEGTPAPLGSGYARSLADADDAARTIAGGSARKLANGMVHGLYSLQRAMERAKRPSASTGTQLKEYLWQRWECDSGHSGWAQVEIVKRTATRVYVLRERWTNNGVMVARTCVVDRAALERDGYAYCPGLRDDLYLEPPVDDSDDSTAPECFEALGLTPPCTADDVRRAYRTRVIAAHPDHGGSSNGFVELRRNYENALSLVS